MLSMYGKATESVREREPRMGHIEPYAGRQSLDVRYSSSASNNKWGAPQPFGSNTHGTQTSSLTMEQQRKYFGFRTVDPRGPVPLMIYNPPARKNVTTGSVYHEMPDEPHEDAYL